ncbi:SRPBCC family protein [Paractinoplanes lichenicola]|uniref:SRPBCC family protein n=1 Tax=Paractinoplanes lichenicola TaxID=2802976 RepID=A0ABS1VXA6_9ACTN|nr:SRPBCC family protein [Actinoplanes lichenicola]MBL7259118.1 SRPBCC family protein [Actinoplanes lichenicola]
MSFDVGQARDARLEGTGEPWTLVFVREFRQAPPVVWAALTDPAELDQWAPFIPERDLNERGPTTFTMVDGDVREDLPAVVRVVEAPKVLEYTWGEDLLRWELEASGEGTRLTLRHTLIEASDTASVATGWHVCAVVLRHLLDGDPHGVIRGREAEKYGFAELKEAYGKVLGL